MTHQSSHIELSSSLVRLSGKCEEGLVVGVLKYELGLSGSISVVGLIFLTLTYS